MKFNQLGCKSSHYYDTIHPSTIEHKFSTITSSRPTNQDEVSIGCKDTHEVMQ